ncbi:MAG: hypothetical protein ACRCY3_10280 [Sphingorhabdus sp.]
MKRHILLGAAAGFAIMGITTAAISGGSVSERRAKALAAYTPAGEVRDCIQISSIRSTNVIDNNTIDFKTTGGKVYRNTLPYSCPSLGFEQRFSYRTSTSQLCSVDTIRVLQSFGGGIREGAGCGLGKFQPMQKVSTR